MSNDFRIVQWPLWFAPFTEKAPFKCAYGGRSASKTLTFSQYFVLKAANEFMRLACCRQFQKSIDQSVKPSIEWAIHHLGLKPRFKINKYSIECPSTGSLMFFEGLERNIENVRGWHEITDVWVEEANLLKEEAADVLIPTIRRGKYWTEFWASFNPKYRTDWVYQRFVVHPEDDDVVRKITYNDNPWHGEQAEDERVKFQRRNPVLYPHVWEGEPDDGDGDVKVLSYAVLRDCLDAFRGGLHENADMGRVESGLDIADGGNDQCAHVIRRGPVIEFADAWFAERPGYLTPTATRADREARKRDVQKINYDSGGVGAPIREPFHRLSEENGYTYSVNPVTFGGAVEGKERMFSRNKTNEQMFNKRNAQMAWALRLRAQSTVRLLAGDKDVDPTRCLFIDPSIPRVEEFMAQLSQAQWRDNDFTGKTELDKRGDLEKSPDLFDAACLAFASDSRSGLRAY